MPIRRRQRALELRTLRADQGATATRVRPWRGCHTRLTGCLLPASGQSTPPYGGSDHTELVRHARSSLGTADSKKPTSLQETSAQQSESFQSLGAAERVEAVTGPCRVTLVHPTASHARCATCSLAARRDPNRSELRGTRRQEGKGIFNRHPLSPLGLEVEYIGQPPPPARTDRIRWQG
jgi:hypothetical protein